MHAAAIAMTTPGRFKLAERALGVGRVLAGRKGRISTLPWPMSGWTNARDVPAPPAETFRQWWARTHGDGSLMDAREEVLARLRTARDDGAPTAPVVVPRTYRPAGRYAARHRGGRRPARRDPDRLPRDRAAGGRPRPTSRPPWRRSSSPAPSVVVPPGVPEAWLARVRRGRPSRRPPLLVDELDHLDAVGDGRAVAIADTGTFVLDSGAPDQGRRVITLVPDHHVCVVRAADVVCSVPEGDRAARPDAPADVRLRARRRPATSSWSASRASTARGAWTSSSSVPKAREHRLPVPSGLRGSGWRPWGSTRPGYGRVARSSGLVGLRREPWVDSQASRAGQG